MTTLRSHRTLTFLHRLTTPTVVALATVFATAPSLIAAEVGPTGVYAPSDHGDHFDGGTYFSMSVSPDASMTVDGAREVVVLFDTSASQTSLYRETALASLDALVGSLRPNDSVRIAAIDLDARPMSQQMAPAGGNETKAALSRLRNEAPLGTTDLVRGLEATLDMFSEASAGNNATQRVVVYIGDGMSNANLMSGRPFKRMLSKLREARISVTSFAIGPDRDSQALAVLANQTGGNLFIDTGMTWADDAAGVSVDRATQENRRRGAGVGRTLAQWVRGTVVWPTQVSASESIEKLLPSPMPPLRSDRDTIVVGRLAPGAKQMAINIEANTANGPKALAWSTQVAQSNETYSYLAQLVREASSNDGITLPTVGSAGLAETGRMMLTSVDNLTSMAERAVSIGDTTSASQIAEAVLRRDPGNLRAKTVQRVVANDGARLPAAPVAERKLAIGQPTTGQAATGQAAGPQASNPQPSAEPTDSLEMVRVAQAPLPPPPAAEGSVVVGDSIVRGPSLIDNMDAYPPAGEVTDGAYIGTVERKNRVIAQMLEREVRNAIEAARDKLSVAPEEAIQELKLQMQNIQNAPELLADVRASLTDRLEAAVREASRASTLKAELDRQREETAASQRETKLINDRLLVKRQREKQLMDRFNALMDERRHAEAQDVAEILREVDPTGVTPIAATTWADHSRAHHLNQVNRAAVGRGFMDALMQVELSAIPIPDEPPIVYPSADVWEELTNLRKKYKAVDLKSQGEAELRISEALQGPLTSVGLDFTETPLGEVVEFLRDEYGIEIQLDKSALEEFSIEEDEPITVNLRNVSLRSALRLMLKDLELTYIIAEEVLLITTQEEADTRLSVKVYPVGDLVIDKTPIQGGGGGGGFGGGGGGFGGGGGGFGGGGGGFGGGGQGGFGGGGGGQFAVPPASETNQQADELVLTSTTTAPAESASESIEVEIDEAKSAAEFAADFFAGERREPATVRSVVRRLMKKKQHEHVIAVIESALRNGQPQPWMYEALGISMQMAGRSPQQIERAVMSAVDFSKSPEELMLIANYLLSLDLDARAIQVYQQVTKIAPARDDAYLLGLRAAERANNLDGILWATEAILSRAWPNEQAGVEDTARRIATATLRKLESEGLSEEFKDYQQRLAKAVRRDCLITVAWTGSADVDLIVEEPGGAVCSAANPRTTSGGVNLGDAYAIEHDAEVGGFHETYVCPEGYAGEYRVRVRRVWGDVAAGKVTVDVITNYGSSDAKRERQQIDLGAEEAVVAFTLDKGRRQQPVEERQLALAIDRQRAVSKAVLAQQLRSMSDPRATPIRPEERVRRRQALARNGGAVGFQPVIQTLPDGTTFTVNAVASADRRYVIVRPSPVFSQIGDVTTFTFAGAGQQNNGGGGAGGGGAGGGNAGGGNGGGLNFP